MNSERLLKRKSELADLQAVNLKEIQKEAKRKNVQEGQDFIVTGEIGQIDGYNLNKLQKKEDHLNKMEDYLIKVIARERKRERTVRLNVFTRTIARLQGQRKGKLYDQYAKLQEEMSELEKKSIALKAEILEIENDRREIERDTVVVHFRLPKVATALEKHYFARPGEVRELVEDAYVANEKKLKEKEYKENLVRGFKITLERDTGKIVDIEPTECSFSLAVDNESILSEVER